jgi:bcr-type benzoyl-CoA reductase subunit C
MSDRGWQLSVDISTAARLWEKPMDWLNEFKAASNDPLACARQWKAAHNRPVVGTFCSYAPEEILLAANMLGLRQLGFGAPMAAADAHLQSYSCSLIRGALADALTGALDVLDAVVFPHTCDSIQRLSDIWRINGFSPFHADLILPAKLNTDSAIAYLVEVLRGFKQQLEKRFDIYVSESDLRKAAEVFNGIRAAVRRIYRCRLEAPGRLSSRDLQDVVKAGMVMDRIRYRQLVEALADWMAQRRLPAALSGLPVVLSGGLCNMPDVYTLIEAAGGCVVWDDLCTGTRAFLGDIALQGDMVTNIARRYALRLNCPAKHAGLRARGDALVQAVHETGARGVVFVMLKFCDPHGFDYPYIKQMLSAAGIPVLFVELDEPGSAAQLTTRLEAFMEMI